MQTLPGRNQGLFRHAALHAAIGLRLRDARERLRWSTAELAGVVGLPAAQIECYENGRVAVPPDALRYLCDALRISESDILPTPEDRRCFADPLDGGRRDL